MNLIVEATVTPQQRRNYYFIVASTISMQITASTIYMVFPLFFSAIGLSKGESGLLISIGTFAGIISSVAAGLLSNRYGRKKVLVLGTLLYTIVFFIFNAVGNSFNALFISRFIAGIGFYIMPVMVTTMAADIFPPGERGRAMGLFSAAGGIGSLIGPLIAPLLIAGSNYSLYFVFSGGFVAVSAVMMLIFVKETLQKEKMLSEKNASKGFKIDVPGFLKSVKGLGAVVGVFLVAILVYRTGLTMIDPFMSLFLEDIVHIDLSQVSYVFAMRALTTIIFSPLAGIMVDKSGSKIVVLLGVFLSIVDLIGFTIAGGFLWMVTLNLVYGITWAFTMTAMNTLMADLLNPKMRGFGLGIQSAISQQSSTLGSLFSGFIIDAYGFNLVFYLAAAFCVVTLVLIQVFVPESRNRALGKSVARA